MISNAAVVVTGREYRTVQRLSIDRVIATIAELVDEAGSDVTIIAVDGHSAAGKSTLAQRLAGRLGAAIIETDDFYRVLDPQVRERLDARGGVGLYYDWQRLREVLATIRAQGIASFEPYDWDRNRLSDRPLTVGPTRLAILEGLFAARPELADKIDISVLVESSSSVRAARQHERADASEEWFERWDAAERLYFQQVRPPDSFDFVVSDSCAGD